MDDARIIELAEKHAALDYGSNSSVHAANLVAGELRAAVLEALSAPEELEQLLGLLNHPTASSWVAYTALKHGALSQFQRARCLSVIRAIAAGQDLASIEANAWLAQHGSEA